MNILSINTFYPCPPRRGMDIIYLNLLKLQATEHDVTVVTLKRADSDEEHATDLDDICADVVFVEPRNNRNLFFKVWHRLLYSALAVFLWRPRCTFYAAPPELRHAVKTLLATQHFDVVEIHHSTTGALVSAIGESPAVLYLYDLHFRAKSRAAALKHGLQAITEWIEAKQFRSFETWLLPHFRLLLCGQEQDKSEAEEIVGDRSRVRLMPNVIDTDAICPDTRIPVENNTIVFVGAMTHQANVDAVLHFAESVWPLIREKVPDGRWWIVGGKPPPEISNLSKRAGISVFADVPDVRPFIAAAAVYIAPLRIGSGVKVKIMEALAMGKAIVATPVAAEGMALEPGRDLVVTDLGPTFSAAIAGIWRDAAARNAMQRYAREAAVARFSVEAGRTTLDQVYDQLRSKQAV